MPRMLVFILCFFIVMMTQALAQSGIDGQIDDPAYMDAPRQYNEASNDNSLRFFFDIDRERCRAYYGNNYYSGCRPRLGLEGQRAENGVSIAPTVEGEWRWSDDYQLTFTPSEVWKANQYYSVKFDLDALGVPSRAILPQNMRQMVTTVKAPALAIEIDNMKYMQDPDDPARKLVTAELSANFPVDAKTLKDQIAVALEQEKNGSFSTVQSDMPFEITMNANNMHANVSVQIKELPDQDRYLRIQIAKGVQPEFGGDATAKIFMERTRVPSLSTYLAINEMDAVIARAQSGAPEQILSMQTNVKTQPSALLEKTRAYLLPFDHPVMGRSKDNASEEPYRWEAANEVTPAILEQSEVLELKPMAVGTDYTAQFGYEFQASPGRYVFVQVDKGLEAFGGYTLERKAENIVQVPAIPNDIEIMQQGSILSLSGAKKLSLHARGTDRLEVEVAQILPESLQHFISQTRGDIRNPSFSNWRFNKDNIARIDVKTVQMAYADPYRSQFAAFDFAPYLKDGRKGIFLLNIQGFKDDKQIGSPSQRFVLVSDLGLLVKQNADNSRDVFLSSFQNGAPVKSAEISVLGQNGLAIFTGRTDKDGHVSLPDFGAYTNDRAPVVIVAQKGEDYAFIPYAREDRMLNTSRFDVDGTRIQADGLNAFVFSDRGIYRPGETAHIGMIVKNADWKELPPSLPLKLVITDPRGRIAQENLLDFASPGLNEVRFETGETWASGPYYANLFIANDGEAGSLLGSTMIRVEEFEPDRLKIKTVFEEGGEAVPANTGWVKPDTLSAKIDLQNLYGTPASNREVSAQVTLNPARLSFAAYPDFKFFDPYAAKARTIEYDLPRVKTDQEGKAEIALQLDRHERATYSLTLQTTGYEAGSGKGVTAYSTALVSPMERVIGYKTEANLGYLAKDKEYQIELKALSPSLEGVAADDLSLAVIKKNYVSTLIKRDDGSYVYESVPREDVIDTQEFKIAAEGTLYTLPSDDLGDYVIRLSDKDGLTVLDVPYSVAGEGQRKGGLDREAVLNIKTNKDDYAAGEEMQINITAPYTGAGLITLESERVVAYKWFNAVQTETVQTIDIPKDFAGKGYVNVAFVRDINSRAIYLSPLSNAIVPFTAGTENRAVGIDLNVPKTAKPGEAMEITYKGNQKGKAIIFAVDEGILQVARYKTPDPVQHFLLGRALQVETAQMLDLLMPEFELIRALSADGGGAMMEDAVMGKHLNPFRRNVLAPAVYWSGIVDLDTTEKTLSFTPPGHFNGQMRVMAIAASQGHVGSAQEDVTVRSELVLTPNMPIFLAPGDEAQGSVTIANGVAGAGKKADISVRLELPEGLEVITAPSESFKVGEGAEETLAFTVKATDTLGPASLVIHASIGDVQQSAEARLSIRPPVVNVTTLQSGYAQNGNAEVSELRDLYPEFAQNNLAVSPLPSAYVYGLLRYLDGFPYGCSEQVTSRVFPQLSLSEMEEFAFLQNNMNDKVSAAVETLRRRQTGEGGFSMWGNGYEADSFISVYAMDFLVEAMNKDKPVPSDMMQNGIYYLRNWVNEDIKSMRDAREKAYGIYVMTRSGIVTTNEILHWLRYFEQKENNEWKQDLAAVYIAASYEMMQQKELAKKTLSDFEEAAFAGEISAKGMDANYPYYNAFIKYAQYVSVLARHFPSEFAKLDQSIVLKLADFVNTNQYSTLSASFAIQALGDYTKAQAETMNAKDITVSANGETVSLSGTQPLKAELPVRLQNVLIENGEKPFFYTLTQSGYNRSINDEPTAKGMEIERSYLDADGNPLQGDVEVGDVIEAVIKVRAHEGSAVQNVAIVDLLPGGLALEVERSASGSTLNVDFAERREDRIILFADIPAREQVYRYRLRAVSKGVFQVPPIYAEAMYDLSKKAKGKASSITVKDAAE